MCNFSTVDSNVAFKSYKWYNIVEKDHCSGFPSGTEIQRRLKLHDVKTDTYLATRNHIHSPADLILDYVFSHHLQSDISEYGLSDYQIPADI